MINNLIKKISTLSLGISLCSCGPDTNVNGLFEPDGKKNSYESLLIKAENAYNKGNYNEASSYIDKALSINSMDEEAVIIKGYIQMSQAGIDGFQLAEGLINQSKEDSSQNLTTSECAEETGAVKILCQLSSVVGIEADEKLLLTQASSSDPELTIPKQAPDARIAGVEVISKINDTINTICAFIDISESNF